MGTRGARREPAKYVERNPLKDSEDTGIKADISRHRPWKREKEKMLLGNHEGPKGNRKTLGVYCNSDEHFSQNCTKVLHVATRRAILQRNRLCYNLYHWGTWGITAQIKGVHNLSRKTSHINLRHDEIDTRPSSKL